MWKRIVAIALVCVSLTLQGCVAAGGGLKAYVNERNGYEFVYPNGWVQIQVNNGPDVVFRDLIEESELVSVVVSNLTGNQTKLSDLGTPNEVGLRLATSVLAPPGSNRQAQLLSSSERVLGDRTYYNLEYYIDLPNAERHNLASVAISRGKLFTLSVSAPESDWSKLEATFKNVANSFAVY
ncbi:photosystem II reaction center PsbP family protein [Lyngbya confervoides BDU141951]|uniref:Photosystem II reaction center PsbP family protein n=2 Tax=Lyngbya TaxID=28073 RepID=A0ABD4T8Z7_9CYAN|nr:photosystem II reaction center PsbP [Lyngbya confervoides]MCM1984800.1 photosystem II reaction center PsbP family protein [Lyngbya confervoides BDU141951]